MNHIELEISALSQSMAQNQSFAVVLAEKEGKRRLPIVIGVFEAQAIAMELEKVKPSRPLTHDLTKNIMQTLGAKLNSVIISNLKEMVFFAKLECEANGEIYYIDARTSDAIALAIRFRCPIFTNEAVMNEAGIIFGDPEAPNITKKEQKKAELKVKVKKISNFAGVSIEKLNAELDKAIEQEDYERAARLRDEIDKRR